jgi:hypothetical protein
VSPNVSILGAIVQRVDQPSPALFALSLTSSGSQLVLTISAGIQRFPPSWALLEERPRGLPADNRIRGMREKLLGGKIIGAWIHPQRLTLVVEREANWLVVEASSSGLSCTPLSGKHTGTSEELDSQESQNAAAQPCPWVPERSLAWGPESTARAWDNAQDFELKHQQRWLENAKSAAKQRVTQSKRKVERRLAALRQDWNNAEHAQKVAERATLFVPAAAKASSFVKELVATDWSSGEPVEVRWQPDPKLPVKTQLERTFSRAKRLRIGKEKMQSRINDSEYAILLLEEALSELEQATEVESLDICLKKLNQELPSDIRLPVGQAPPQTRSKQKNVDEKSRPFRSYLASSGERIWVGKNAKSNDELTLRWAKPGDLWLHAKGVPGSHVVVPGASKQGVTGEVLAQACMLAAHFSDARGEQRVEVSYCDKRYVQKRKGMGTGQVLLLREKVMIVRMQPDVLETLMATCDRDLLPKQSAQKDTPPWNIQEQGTTFTNMPLKALGDRSFFPSAPCCFMM